MEINESKQQSRPDQLRRKLFRGVPAGIGVLLAVQAKTALGAGVCASPSKIFSGNTSPRPGSGTSCSGGLSPGYWKQPQHFGSWVTAGAIAPTFKKGVDVCSTGISNLSLNNINNQGTLLSAIPFSGVTLASGTPAVGGGYGIWAVLAFPGSFGNGQLLRHLSAAWLNAGFFKTDPLYPVTRAQIVQMWESTKGGGIYCPGGGTSCTTGWTATDVINYISGMYDINASGDPSLCQQP